MNPKGTEFTLIDAFNQFWQVWEVAAGRSLTCVGLYFYLVKKWNASGRANAIRLQNNLICAELEISKPTLNRGRNWLRQNNLVEFFSKGKGDSNITYVVKKFYYLEGEKEKIFTTNVTTNVTSRDSLNKEKELEKELFVVVSEEVKNFYYLKDLFEADVGLTMNWSQKGLPAAKFLDGLEQWMIQNNGAKYGNMVEARKHFLYWMPNYGNQKTNLNGSSSKQQRQAAALNSLIEIGKAEFAALRKKGTGT